jgi:hypothetical protein
VMQASIAGIELPYLASGGRCFGDDVVGHTLLYRCSLPRAIHRLNEDDQR